MTKNELEVLEKIVELEGDCLLASLCDFCPFRLECLPIFVMPHREPLSKGKRCQMALSALSTKVFEEMI